MSSDEMSKPSPGPAGKVFHVVCRDCTLEELTATRAAANVIEATHRNETDHTVVRARIQ